MNVYFKKVMGRDPNICSQNGRTLNKF
jgi:hypothetical protein